MRTFDQARRCTPFDQWPEIDRDAFVRGCTPTDPYDDDDEGPRYGDTLGTESREKVRKGYGRWLCFLQSRNLLDPEIIPIARLTDRRRIAFLKDLKLAGNADATIIGRFHELEMAIRIMTPGQDTSFIRKLGQQTIYSLLPKTKRSFLVPDSRVLFQWGLDLMDGVNFEMPRWCPSIYRDGLLIAMLAARGRRIRSMHLLRVGRELTWTGTCYRIELQEEQHKTKGIDKFNLPKELTPYIKRYLDEVRPILLNGAWHEELWINQYGRPTTLNGIKIRIFRLSKSNFGLAFGPHRFRHAIATTLTLERPDSPGLSAAVLRISYDVNEASYVRAGQIEACLDYADVVRERRKRLGLK